MLLDHCFIARLTVLLACLLTFLTVYGCGRIEFEALQPVDDSEDTESETASDFVALDTEGGADTGTNSTDIVDTGIETDTRSDVDTTTTMVIDSETLNDTAGSTDTFTDTFSDTDSGVETDTGADTECPVFSDTDYVEIFGETDFDGFSCYNTVTCTAVSATPPDASFSRAWRAEYLHVMTKPSFTQLYQTIDGAIDAGDHLLLEFWTRCASDSCHTGVLIEQNASPWANLIEFYTTADSNWEFHQVPFVAAQSFAAGDTQISFRLGYVGQTIEIYPKRIINYGAISTVPRPECLPNTTSLYNSISFGYVPPAIDVSYVKSDDVGNYGYLLNVEVNSRPAATITASGYPDWLSWSATANALSGTPATALLGLSPIITIEATNEFGTISYQYQINVEIEP